MTMHKVASRQEWLKARKALLAEEKALTHQRDAVSAKRRELPWVRVEKAYAFDGPRGRETLADLFESVASSSSITSCSVPTGRRAARPAPSWPTISTAPTSISSIMT